MHKEKLTLQQIYEIIKSNTEIKYLSEKYSDLNIVRDIKDNYISLWVNKNQELYNYHLSFTFTGLGIVVKIAQTNTYPHKEYRLEFITNNTEDPLNVIRCSIAYYFHFIFSNYIINDIYLSYDIFKADYIEEHYHDDNSFVVWLDHKLDYVYDDITSTLGNITILKGPYRTKTNLFLWFITFGYVTKKWYYTVKKII